MLPPLPIIEGKTARVIRNIDFTFTLIIQSHSDSVVSRNGFIITVPAWLKRISIRFSKRLFIFATAVSTSPEIETSHFMKKAFPLLSQMRLARSAPTFSCISTIATKAPSRAKISDAAPPAPAAPPHGGGGMY